MLRALRFSLFPSAPLVHIEGGCGSLFVGECSAEFRFDPPTVWLLEA